MIVHYEWIRSVEFSLYREIVFWYVIKFNVTSVFTCLETKCLQLVFYTFTERVEVGFIFNWATSFSELFKFVQKKEILHPVSVKTNCTTV